MTNIIYPIDWGRDWTILFNNKETRKAIISAKTKDLRVDGALFGDNVICTVRYDDIKLPKFDAAEARYAKRTKNKELLEAVYDRVFTHHRSSKDR